MTKRIRRRDRVLGDSLNGQYWGSEPEVVGVSRGTQTNLDPRDLEILILKRDMDKLETELEVITAYCQELTEKLKGVGEELGLIMEGLE